MFVIMTGPGVEDHWQEVCGEDLPEPRRRTGALRWDDLPDTPETRTKLEAAAETLGADLFFFAEGLPSAAGLRRAYFDMDSTLIQNECIDDMAAFYGVGEEVAEITRLAMEGHLPFSENLRRRVRLLAGAPYDVVTKTIGGIRYTPGVEDLIGFLRRHGVECFIVSGGFREIALTVATHLGMTGVITNELVVDDGRLTGDVTGPAGGDILDADGKRRALEILTAAVGAKRSETLAAGDGANDLRMVGAAGLGVAFHAKPVLASAAKLAVRRGGLDAIVPVFEEAWLE